MLGLGRMGARGVATPAAAVIAGLLPGGCKCGCCWAMEASAVSVGVSMGMGVVCREQTKQGKSQRQTQRQRQTNHVLPKNVEKHLKHRRGNCCKSLLYIYVCVYVYLNILNHTPLFCIFYINFLFKHIYLLHIFFGIFFCLSQAIKINFTTVATYFPLLFCVLFLMVSSCFIFALFTVRA